MLLKSLLILAKACNVLYSKLSWPACIPPAVLLCQHGHLSEPTSPTAWLAKSVHADLSGDVCISVSAWIRSMLVKWISPSSPIIVLFSLWSCTMQTGYIFKLNSNFSRSRLSGLQLHMGIHVLGLNDSQSELKKTKPNNKPNQQQKNPPQNQANKQTTKTWNEYNGPSGPCHQLFAIEIHSC